MKKFINKVTVTGADDLTDIPKLIALAEKYPFMEIALLLSRKQVGSMRYPSNNWLTRFFREYKHTPNVYNSVSGHICGSMLTEFLKGVCNSSL